MKRCAGLLTLCVALMAGACTSAGYVPPGGGASGGGPSGRESALPQVMSMNPCTDAILVEVADPGQIVSISHYSHDPAASSLPLEVARRFSANMGTAEEVIAQRPDLVLLSPHVSRATQAAIRAAGIRIVSAGVPVTVEESRSQIKKISKSVHQEARGQALLARIDMALARARPPGGASVRSALIRMKSGLVPGSGTLADELLARTGFRNMSADYGLANWDVLPLEPLVAHPPALLLGDYSDPASRHRVLRHLREMTLADFPEHLLQCAGPSLIEVVARLARIRRQMAGS